MSSWAGLRRTGTGALMIPDGEAPTSWRALIMRFWGDFLPGHSWHLNLKVFGHLYWTFVLFFSLYLSELMLQVPLLRQIDPCSITTQKGYLEWFELLMNLQAAGKLTCLFCGSSNWITNRKTKRRSSAHEHWTAPPLTSPPGAATLKLYH